MAEMIICSSCGGECSEELANCPYCGSTLLAGAEKKYMEQLRDVKDRMEDLDAVPLEETRSAIRKQGMPGKDKENCFGKCKILRIKRPRFPS